MANRILEDHERVLVLVGVKVGAIEAAPKTLAALLDWPLERAEAAFELARGGGYITKNPDEVG